eukprot:Pgem_evm1s2691
MWLFDIGTRTVPNNAERMRAIVQNNFRSRSTRRESSYKTTTGLVTGFIEQYLKPKD